MSLSIGEAANCIGVAVSTLRRWESEGKCCADFRTHGRHRRYSLTRLQTQIRNHQQESSTPLQEKNYRLCSRLLIRPKRRFKKICKVEVLVQCMEIFIKSMGKLSPIDLFTITKDGWFLSR